MCNLAIVTEDVVFSQPAIRSGGIDSVTLWKWFLGLRKAKELRMPRRFIDNKSAT